MAEERCPELAEGMDGLISFYASHHAIRADKVLREAGFGVALIPGPRELSPNCGVALRFVYARAEAALGVLSRNKVQIEAVHEYRPRVADWTEAETSTGRGEACRIEISYQDAARSPACLAPTSHLRLSRLWKGWHP